MKRSTRVAITIGLLVAIAGVLAVAVRLLLGGDRIKSALEAQATAALGRPVSIKTATAHLLPRVGIELTGIAIGTAQEVTIEQARLTTGLRALLGRRVEDADISIERSRIDLRWALSLLEALSGNRSTAGAPGSAALTIDSIGSLTLRDITLVAGARTLVVDLDSALSGGDRFVVRRLRGVSEGSNLIASGELTSLAKRTGTFAIDGETLDLDGLLAFLTAATPAGAASAPPSVPSAPRAPPPPVVPLHLDIAVKARSGRAAGAALNNVETTARVRGSAIALEGLKMNLFGGRFDGSVAVDGSQATPKYEWRGRVENLDMPAIVAFAGSPGAMTGRLSGSMALAASGLDPQAALERARGTARIVVTDGRVPNLDLVRKVVLAFGRPTGERPEGSGEVFSRLAATLNVGGRALSTSDLTFVSRDVDMTGEGTLSLATQALDFRTNIVLSPELSAQAGRDLYRVAHEGDRVVLPARITGTVAAPTVFVDVEAALKRAIRNRAQDEIKSLFERLGRRK
jgi:AsmA-like C-terminal region